MENPRKFLKKVRFDKALRIKKGVFVHNYYDLLKEIDLMTKSEFKEFLSKNRNTVLEWIRENYQDDSLIKILKNKKSQNSYKKTIKHRLKVLEKELDEKQATREPYLSIAYVIIFGVFIALFYQFIVIPNIYVHARNYSELNREIFYLNEDISKKEQTIAWLESQVRRLEEESRNEKIILPVEEEIPAPKNRINQKDIDVNDTALILSKDNLLLAIFEDTGSMLPVLDSKTTGIQIKPESEKDIVPGDIISFRDESGKIIIHRVLEINKDLAGWYAITKGDNNPSSDLKKVRFEKIERVLIGILY